MDDLSKFCCQNPKCADYGKRGAGNLMVNITPAWKLLNDPMKKGENKHWE
jgi:hypothetical protein